MAYPDLCALADVTRYLPGYTTDATIDATLSALISAESVEIIRETGKEFVAISPPVNPRSFDVTAATVRYRKLPIGACSSITTVTQKRNGVTVQVIASGDYIAEPRVRHAWEPLKRLRFPQLSGSPVLLQEEDVIEINATTWGYPAIPTDIAQACAKMVIVRYVSDVAKEGTQFADAVTDDINVGGLFVSAREAISSYRIP